MYTTAPAACAGADLIEKIEMEGHALTVDSFADLLQVSRKLVYREIQSGRLSAYRAASILRINPSDATKWMCDHLTIKEGA